MEHQQTHTPTNIPSANANPNNLRIHHHFLQLQHHWNHCKACSQPNPPSSNHPPTMLHNDSPPDDDLISSLQRHGDAPFSASSTWKIRTNQLAKEEIRRERRDAIDSGRLRARKLSYDDAHMGPDLNDDFLHGNYWNGVLQDQIFVPPILSSDSGEECAENCNREFLGKEKEEQVPVCLNDLSYSSASSSSSVSSSSSSSCLLCKKMNEQKAAKIEENVTPSVGEKREFGNWCKIGKREVGLAWLAIASVAMLIFSVRCLGLGAYDEERLPPFLLVPT